MQAGGDRRRVFLDDLPEAGGEMRGSWIGSLAPFPQCQVEFLGCPTGTEEGGGMSYNRNLRCSQYTSFLSIPLAVRMVTFTWPKRT